MKLESRRDQLCYFLGFVGRTRRNQLIEAEKKLVNAGYQQVNSADAFEFCPYNDTQEQILRSYSIFETGSPHDFVSRLMGLLGEYLFLTSDFVPPCCDDGRTFYCHGVDTEIVLICDRCGTGYALDETQIDEPHCKKITKSEFAVRFGSETSIVWPLHNKIKELLKNKS